MSSEWETLPNEVLNNIFQHLFSKDKLQCALTCRAWKSAAQRGLFNKIAYLKDEKMYNLATTLSNCNPDHSPGNYVKTVECSLLSADFDIELLDTIFPFLEAINISGRQQKLYDKICHSIKNGRFANLITVPYTKWDKNHAKFVLTRKEYIKELKLRDTYFDDGTYDIFEELQNFPKLESLYLYSSSIERRGVSLEGLLKNNNPTLRTINFDFDDNSRILLNPSTEDINNIQPLPNVRELILVNRDLLSSGNNALIYIMKKFPNLDKLRFLCREQPPNMRNYIYPTLDCLSQFLVYLFHIKERCSVRNLIAVQYTADIINNFFKFLSTQTTKTSGSVESRLIISLETMDRRDEGYINDRTAYIHYLCINNVRIVMVTYKVLPNSTFKPYVELFQKVGDINIDTLIVDCTIGPFLMDTVSDNFTKLKSLELEGNQDIIISETNLQEKSQSKLESLKFLRCGLKKELFTDISKKYLKLKVLEITHSYFYDNTVQQNSEKIFQYVSIDMKSTCLLQLTFTVSLENYFNFHKYSKMFIRLRTASKKARYCKIALQELPDSTLKTDFVYDHFTDADYKAHLKYKDCVVYSIYCEAVKTFVVNSDMDQKRVFVEEDT